jgi:GNAT superfamily N-acetyltransferase
VSQPLRGWSHTLVKQFMLTIGFLADFLETIPRLVTWFRNQWPDYYANMSPAEMAQDFLSEASRDFLPIRLVAFHANRLAGTIVLRERGSVSLAEFQPELGGLYVAESLRGLGIATELIRAGMNMAREQNYEAVYATTVSAAGILERLGWEFLQTVNFHDEELALYRCILKALPHSGYADAVVLL